MHYYSNNTNLNVISKLEYYLYFTLLIIYTTDKKYKIKMSMNLLISNY